MWTRSFTTLIKHADDRKGRLLASARSFPEGTGIPYFSELLTLDSEFGEQGNQIGEPVQGGMTIEQCLISSGEADLVSVLDGNEMESMRSGPRAPECTPHEDGSSGNADGMGNDILVIVTAFGTTIYS